MWWLSDFARVGREKTAVERLVAEGWFALSRWRVHDFRFGAEGTITARDVEYHVRLLYPDQFPHVPAWVEPQDAAARWSKHQYGDGGVLCLELRPDNWSPDATGADVLRSAFHLLDVENPEGEGEQGTVISGHRVGAIQAYSWGQEPVLIGAGCATRLLAGTSEGVAALRWGRKDDVWPALLFDSVDRAKPSHPPSFDLSAMRVELPVVVASNAAPTETPSSRSELAAAISVDLDAQIYSGAIMVVAVSSDRLVVYHSPDEGHVYERKWVLLPEDDGKRSDRSAQTQGKRAAIIGVGSVGSKLSETLLRSGVHSFLLVDGDIFVPGNLERHALDWRDVGFRKANAMKRRLLEIVPGAQVDVLDANLNWQRSAKVQADAVDKIADCSLIINATGDAATSLWLSAIADANQIPFVSASVFEGGLGCLIARALPGRDPAYGLGRLRYEAFCTEQNVEPPPSGRRTYEALLSDGEPIVADDAAVSMTASHAARVILDILDGRVDDADMAWLLIAFRKGWLFERHGHSIALDVGGPAPPEEVVEDEAARAFAMELARNTLDALKNTD